MGRRWTGPSFFGFDRPDVRVAVEEALLLPPVPVSNLRKEHATLCVAQEKYVETFAVPGTGRTGTFVQWAGVMHHGEPVESPHWLIAGGMTTLFTSMMATRAVVSLPLLMELLRM